jgi:glycosyltransferase involved in cell wall biosynthesis
VASIAFNAIGGKFAIVAGAQPRLAMVLTEDWFFLSHFLERAIAARDAGYEVTVLANDNGHGGTIRAAGLAFQPVAFARRRMNPFAEIGTFRELLSHYRALKPDIVHHVALKPILYGSLAARFAGVRHIVNAPVGMGYVFTSQSATSRVLRPAVAVALRALLNPRGSKVVFENPDDRAEFIASGTARADDAVVIRGAGVDIEAFAPIPEPMPPVTIVLVARMLWDKGVGEFVGAARALRSANRRFLLVGTGDPQNPASISEDELRSWNDEGVVEWLGHRTDVAEILSKAHIACLPSYREGLPKSLLEALAAGLPVVTTDVPGCRETVTDGVSGLLVPPHDADALAGALWTLIEDADLRRQFGAASRRRAETEFASSIVIAETLALYASLVR